MTPSVAAGIPPPPTPSPSPSPRRARAEPLAEPGAEPVALAQPLAVPLGQPEPAGRAGRPVRRTAIAGASGRDPGVGGRVDGSVATIEVPRPGFERITNVPFASSTRSRIDARPTRPCRRNSRVIALSKPRPSSSISTRSDDAVGLDRDHDVAGPRVLRGVRQRFLHDAVGERLEIGRQRSRQRAREDRVDTPCSIPNRVTVSRRAGISPRSSSTGGRSPDIRARSASASSASSLRIFESTSTPRSTSPGLDHQQGGFEGERRGRDPLHGPVVEVARDPVPLGLDRGVRPAQEARAVLVLSWRNFKRDRIVWSAALPGVTSRTSRAGEEAWWDLGHPRLQVERGPVRALVLGLPGGGELGEPRVGAVERRRQRLPALPLDHRAIEMHHLTERLVRPDDSRSRPAPRCRPRPHRRRAGGAPPTLQGLVRFADPVERGVDVRQGDLLLTERAPDGLARLRDGSGSR